MCRHVFCERRGRTRQERVPGPRPPRAAPVSAITVTAARESGGPSPGCLAQGLDSGYRKQKPRMAARQSGFFCPSDFTF